QLEARIPLSAVLELVVVVGPDPFDAGGRKTEDRDPAVPAADDETQTERNDEIRGVERIGEVHSAVIPAQAGSMRNRGHARFARASRPPELQPGNPASCPLKARSDRVSRPIRAASGTGAARFRGRPSPAASWTGRARVD